MGRVQDQTQLVGTLGWCSCPRPCRKLSPDTPQGPVPDLFCRIYSHPLSSHLVTSSVGSSLPWEGGRCQGTPSTSTAFHETHQSHWSWHPLHPTSSKRFLSHPDLVRWTHQTHSLTLPRNICVIVITRPHCCYIPIVLLFLLFVDVYNFRLILA